MQVLLEQLRWISRSRYRRLAALGAAAATVGVRLGVPRAPISAIVLGYLVAALVFGHALLAGSTHSPLLLGALLVFGMLLLRPVVFVPFAVVVTGQGKVTLSALEHVGLSAETGTRHARGAVPGLAGKAGLQ